MVSRKRGNKRVGSGKSLRKNYAKESNKAVIPQKVPKTRSKAKEKSIKHHLKNIHKHVYHHITQHPKKLHAQIYHSFRRRKHIEHENLPKWKRKFLGFNEKHLEWLENFVDRAIPWLVLILLFIIIAELGNEINHLFELMFHKTSHLLELAAEFAHHYHTQVIIADKTIIGFFIVDLYFNFFRKATFLSFLKSFFLDIIAILPLGFLAGIATTQVSTAQTATHIAVDSQRIATRSLESGKLLEAGKIARSVKTLRIIRIITRLPRLLRLYRLYYFFAPKNKNKKNKSKKSKTKIII
ncbi:MAG: hypothetical protein ABIG89_02930 [Candidatus Woesearchaeota archaeon]